MLVGQSKQTPPPSAWFGTRVSAWWGHLTWETTDGSTQPAELRSHEDSGGIGVEAPGSDASCAFRGLCRSLSAGYDEDSAAVLPALHLFLLLTQTASTFRYLDCTTWGKPAMRDISDQYCDHSFYLNRSTSMILCVILIGESLYVWETKKIVYLFLGNHLSRFTPSLWRPCHTATTYTTFADFPRMTFWSYVIHAW